ncbi:nitroreductase family protein [Floricoccus penangensis]|uniref:nitroreductase family protein n=1 Tax=Floricoccus penangensis TaxID=1859475 RepID=UPI00203F6CD9|nr:nitroreductase family protein [Floricoccus penangensis]URZ87838.1 nitroreductase family protein [Floricoccus penangensis]
MSFLENLEKRRSIYNLGKDIDVDQAIGTIKEAVRLSPSAFNSQTSRILILTGKEQDRLWELVTEDLRLTMSEQGASTEAFEATKAKLASFGAAAGTALFFEDQDIIKNLQEQFPIYADNFQGFSEQHTGIAAVNAWTALAEINVGGNLQHYNPLIDESVAKTWGIPTSWKLRSQLVFGSIEEAAGEKEFMNDEDRFRVFK